MVWKNFRFTKKYVESIFEIANVDPKKIGNLLTSEEVTKIYETPKEIVSDVVSGNHDPIIVENEKIEVLPVKLGKLKGEITNIPSFIEGLDSVFTKI